ncbi:MAG: transporter substrate-binding domain-containing protein [Proteobacteria bacterium]|nr:transporter substrate-binding domain-containing protein [Pseudomonadota bacterium]
MKKIVFILISGVLFFIHIPAARGITLGYAEFPPYEYRENGTPAGIQVEIVKILCQRAGIPLELVYLPFKRAYMEAKNGSIDGLFNFYKTEERLAAFDYTDPLIENPLVFFVKKESQLTYTRLEDLKGLKVGVMQGYTYGREFDQSAMFTKEASTFHASAFHKLVRGRIHIYPCDKLVGIHVARQNELMIHLKILPVPLMVMEGYIGFTKGRHPAVIGKINAELKRMKQKNEIQILIDRYLNKP